MKEQFFYNQYLILHLMVRVGYEITVIKPGVLARDRFGNILDARSSVTLIRNMDLKIIVDTGFYDEKPRILDELSKHNLKPSDIDMVINTHLHADHTGNNDLFDKAQFIGHKNESGSEVMGNCRIIDKDMEIAPGVKIIETPGHTKGSISVIVAGHTAKSEINRFAITGDALPIMDNYIKWVPPGINIDPQLALDSMQKIVTLSKIIIPGHDKPFIILNHEHRNAEYL